MSSLSFNVSKAISLSYLPLVPYSLAVVWKLVHGLSIEDELPVNMLFFLRYRDYLDLFFLEFIDFAGVRPASGVLVL